MTTIERTGFLDHLLSDSFAVSIGIPTSPKGLRRALNKSKDVNRLRRDIESGIIGEDDIRTFVSRLMADFNRGVRFPHELAIAALSVALENRKTSFVEEFFLDLARLNITEMILAPGVARDCLRYWYSLPRTRVKTARWKPEQARQAYRAMRHTSQYVVYVKNRSLARHRFVG